MLEFTFLPEEKICRPCAPSRRIIREKRGFYLSNQWIEQG